jgi:hypothetical protein
MCAKEPFAGLPATVTLCVFIFLWGEVGRNSVKCHSFSSISFGVEVLATVECSLIHLFVSRNLQGFRD